MKYVYIDELELQDVTNKNCEGLNAILCAYIDFESVSFKVAPFGNHEKWFY